MSIACICMCRDECDIIELFCRINCRVFDHIYIIDNNSADATPRIIENLQAEGYPITMTFDADNTYNQDSLTTKAMYSINAMGRYDWFMFLDADEFVSEPKDDIIHKFNAVPQHLTPKCMWRSWIPTNLDYFSHKAPLYNCFNPLKTENHITYKAVINRGKAPHVRINHGNHAWIRRDNGLLVPDKDCGVRIDHFPVRSAEQIVSKAVLNHYRQTIRAAAKINKADLGPVRTFFQLGSIHTCLRETNYQITPQMLRRFGVMYNVEMPPTGNDPQIDSAIEGEHFGFDDDEIKYLDLSKIALGARFDKQMDIMHGVIKKMSRKLQELGVIS